MPDDLKGKDDTKGEASLKGHLKNGDEEEHGSQAYVPPDPKNDKQLIAAEDLLRGVRQQGLQHDAFALAFERAGESAKLKFAPHMRA